MENREKIIDYFRNFDILNPSTNRIGSTRFIDFSFARNRPETRGTETVFDLNDINSSLKHLFENTETSGCCNTNKVVQYDTYIEEEYFDYNSDDDEESVLKVMPRYDGQFEMKMTVSDYYYPYLIGRNQMNLRKLQEQCNAKIRIPSAAASDSLNDTIEIVGKSERIVLTAKRILEMEIAKIHSRLEPNYYLAVPIDNVTIRQNFDLFKRKVCSGNYVRNLNGKLVEETFVSGDRLHITIGMLKLFSEIDRLEINQHLTICNETILEPFLHENDGSLTFNVKGVDSFTDDPTMVRVVFAKILNDAGRNHEKLQTLLETIRRYFRDEGLIDDAGKDNKGPLQMHMTLMNAKYLQNEVPSTQRVLMDCEKLFKEFANFDFGMETMKGIKVVPRIHLYRSNV